MKGCDVFTVPPFAVCFGHENFAKTRSAISGWARCHFDRSVSALQTKFFRDHPFDVENGRRASECRFSIVRHSFQRTLPVAEAFQTIRI
jgi:hypothetical protein